MRQPFRWLTALAALWAGMASAAQPAPLTPASYRAELDRLIAATEGIERRPADATAIGRSLPPSWRVEVGQRTFELPSDSLRRDLLKLASHADAKDAAAIRTRLRRLRDDIDAYLAPPADRTAPRARVAAILAAPEFSDVHGPTWYDRLKQQVFGFLADLLGRLLGASSVPTVGRILIYGLLALAILAAGVWVHRTLRRRVGPETIQPAEAPASAKTWAVWLAEARAAAARGAWPDAVRLAYWAGISSLESRKLWPADRARTPREYLRLVPHEHEYGRSLASLTSTFERVWYGREAADDGTFAAAIEELERLGCHPR